MKIIRIILLQIYVFGICGNSLYGKGWITDFLFLAINIAFGIADCMKKDKSKSAVIELKLDIFTGFAFILYAHFFMGSNGVRNPYGLLDHLYPSIIFWGIMMVIWLIVKNKYEKKEEV